MFRLRWWMPWRRLRSNIVVDWCLSVPATLHDWTLTEAATHDWTLTDATLHDWTMSVEVIVCG